MPRYNTNKPRSTASLDELIRVTKPFISNRARRWYFVNNEQANVDIDYVYDIHNALLELQRIKRNS